MKTYNGKAKVKDDSTYIYKGLTLDITGVYTEFKNGSGCGVYPEGSRQYNISLKDKGFQFENTVIHDNHLENVELFESTILPLDEKECLELIEFSQKTININKSKGFILQRFLESKRNLKSVLPYINYSTLYDDEDDKIKG